MRLAETQTVRITHDTHPRTATPHLAKVFMILVTHSPLAAVSIVTILKSCAGKVENKVATSKIDADKACPHRAEEREEPAAES